MSSINCQFEIIFYKIVFYNKSKGKEENIKISLLINFLKKDPTFREKYSKKKLNFKKYYMNLNIYGKFISIIWNQY
jgi:hypothetical protein